MGLDDYRKKRDFSRTPEPATETAAGDRPESDPSRRPEPPAPVASVDGSRGAYVIQKHAARRLHYDLRLELDGVLLSWAVPKGPSLDPADKRLAVRVEDHPLNYADFEGTIPAGEYGGGTVMVWDRGTWEPCETSRDDPAGSLDKGQLKFELHGGKLRGRWMLVHLKDRAGESGQKNWLLFKERDDEARSGTQANVTESAPLSVRSGRTMEQIAADGDRPWHTGGEMPGEVAGETEGPAVDPAVVTGARRRPLPERSEPQLATLVAEAPRGDDWLHEIKFDGYRVLCRLDDGRPRFLTRRGADWTDHFPTLLEPAARLPAGTALLDGEVVYVKDDGRTSFLKLASALQSGSDPEGRIVYYVFDLLYRDGYDVTRAPLHVRKELLAGLLSALPDDAPIRYVDHVRGDGDEFHRVACGHELEGSISKRAGAPYRSGRGRDWLKVKCLHRQEFVIGGFTERAGGGGIGALLLGFRGTSGEPLRYAGRVGTGWDHRTMDDLRARLDELVRDEPTFIDAPSGRAARGVLWVLPELVAEIEYLSWNGHGTFRHASFKGLRLDKPAADVVPEQACDEPSQPFAPAPDSLRPPDSTTALASAALPESAASPDSATSPPGPGIAAPSSDPVHTRPLRKGEEHTIVGGVVITNPHRVMYPEAGLTKLDIARYYEGIADRLLPFISRRPLTLVRCPEGYAEGCFFQKHAVGGFPDTVIRVPIAEHDGTATYVAVDSTAGLLSLVQLGTLELHVWGSHLETVEYPDELVFDLDPDPELPFTRVSDAARLLRTALDALGLQSFVTTTGGKGLHVVAPIEPTRPWKEVKAFARAVAEALVAADPDSYTATMSKQRRTGKVYVDYLRNGRGATFISPYSTRRRPGAPVATPLRWDELSPRLRADRYDVANIRRRLAALDTDPWEGFHRVRQELTAAALRSVGA
jgi:bifunctional non-homologous end joining protein LigD